MKIDNFIKTCFPDENSINVPKVNETNKLAKTWKKVIVDLEKDYGPKTKEVKRKIKSLKEHEERVDNEKLNLQRKKIEAERDLIRSQEDDKKVLEKIIGKYQGDKLFKEISRLSELPIESLMLISKDKINKSSRISATITDGENERVEPQVFNPYYPPLQGSDYVTASTITTSSSYYADSGDNIHSITEPEALENKKEINNLPYLVIFTKPLKTEIPTKEELKPFNLLKRMEMKSWGDREIGRFIMIIDLASMGRYNLKTFNLDKIVDDSYDHACISNGSVCLGNKSETYDKLAKNYQIFDMVDLLFDHLISITTARPVSNPYIEWNKWFERVKPVNNRFTQKRIKRVLSGKFGCDETVGYDEIRSMGQIGSVGSISYSGIEGASISSDLSIPSDPLNDQRYESGMRDQLDRLTRELSEQRNQLQQYASQAISPNQYFSSPSQISQIADNSARTIDDIARENLLNEIRNTP